MFNGAPSPVTSINYATPPLATTYTTPGALPNRVPRSSLLLGQSLYSGNFNFQGWIDSFQWYNFALSPEAITAHSVLARPPMLEFVAATDPHTISGVDTAGTGYQWMSQDPVDATTTTHKGVVKLSSTSSQWINLAASTGAATIGTSFTTTFGDGLSYANMGPANTNSSGYSFEVSIKFNPPAGASSSKIFELGNGASQQEVILSLTTTSATAGSVSFNVYRSDATATAAYSVIPSVVFSQWYHIVVVLAPSGMVISYVNGVATTSGITLFPQAVARTHVQLGKSDWTGDVYLNAFIDSFRMYDYSLSPAVVSSLYNVTSQGLPPATAVVVPPPTQFTSGPQLAYTFDSAPALNAQDAYDTTFTWISSFAAPVQNTTTPTIRTAVGVASFNGVYETGDFVDMTIFPDSYGNTFNFPFGGAVSFESWFYYNPAGFSNFGTGNGYQYLLSTSGELGQGNNNFGFTTVGTLTSLMVSAFVGTSSTGSHITDSYSAPTGRVIAYPGSWQHVIVSVQPLSFGNFGATGANFTFYFNGQLVWSQLGAAPAWVIRSQDFLGRSSDDQNFRFWGNIDSFYFYNYALSAEAAALHYLVPRAPRFELVFDRNPLAVTNVTASTSYSWLPSFTTHTGVLTLSSTAGSGWGSAAPTGQWINLATNAGPTSVGTLLPTLGGVGIGLAGGKQMGWTVEVTFQVTSSSATPNMVLLDMAGATAAQDEFLLSFVPGSCAMQVLAYGGSAGTSLTNVTVIPCVTTSRWYHLVVSMTSSTISPTRATYCSYVNSVLTNVVNGAALRQAPRPNAFLGRSLADASASTGTLAFNGMIDAFRIYDFAAIPDDVGAMFSLEGTDAPPITPMPISSSQPQNQWTFDSASTAAAIPQGSFIYEAGRGSHYGLAFFRGSTSPTVLTNNVLNISASPGDYVNLVTYPDAMGNTLPTVIGGGPASFEVWAEWSEWDAWSRLIDWGACGGCDNIAISQNGNTADSPILSFHSANGGSPSTPMTTAGPGQVTDCDMNNGGLANGPLTLNTWLHIVCVYIARDPFELASTLAADLSCWVNGVPQLVYSTNYANPPLATNYSTPGAMPNAVARPLGLLGQSNYGGNYAFNGWIDSVYWYNFAMATEEVLWHYTAPRPAAVMEVTAARDPRLTTGTTRTATYSWLALDVNDSPAVQAVHTGLISLSNGQYVDLTVGSGPASLGQALPSIFGDGKSFAGLILNTTAPGLSFEVIIKFPSLPTASTKVFELGNGYQSNEVVLNYVASSQSLTFNSYRTSFTTPADLVLVSGVTASTWYHLMVTLSTGSSSTAASSTASLYVNGRQVGSSITNAVFPAAVARTRAWLGRSDWPGEGNLTALIDAFRVYDYVVPSQSVVALYNVSTYGLAPVPPVTPASFYQYQSGPQLAYTLDAAPPANELNFNTNFTWTASSTSAPNPDGTLTLTRVLACSMACTQWATPLT